MRRIPSALAAVAAALLLAGCAYEAAPVRLPDAVTAAPAPARRIAGDYLLYVDSTELRARVRPSGGCSVHTFDVDLRRVFEEAVAHGVRRSVGSVELVGGPVPAEEVARRGKAGLITIRAGELEAAATVPMLAAPEARVSFAVAAGVQRGAGEGSEAALAAAASAPGRLLAACGGVGRALAEAGRIAVGDVVLRLEERLHSAP